MIVVSPKLIAAIVIGGSLIGAGWMARGVLADRKIAQIRADQAEKVAQAEAAARAREHAIIDRTEEIVREARTTVENLRADAAAAVVAADGLRAAAARYAARRCPAAPAGPASGGSPAIVPPDMRDGDRLLRVLGELDGAAGALAEHADRARAAGLACERSYEAVRK